MTKRRNGDVPEVEVRPARRESSALSGRPPKNFAVWRDRQRERNARGVIVAARRALAYLREAPIDATWCKVFDSVADRFGFARVIEQRGTTTSTSLTVGVATRAESMDDLVARIRTMVAESETAQ